MQPSWGTGKGGTLAMRVVRHGVVRVEDALAVVCARAEVRHTVRGGGPREARKAARGERVAEREVHVRPARAYVETKADIAGHARPKRLIGRGWPKLGAAWCTIWR